VLSEAACITPEVFAWARSTAGFSIEDVARRLKIDEEKIFSWENGKGMPSYNQLEKIAYEIFKKPIAIFFFPTPPRPSKIMESFRLIRENEAFLPDTYFALNEAELKMVYLKELDEYEESKNSIKWLEINNYKSIEKKASAIREWLGFSIDEQIRIKKYPDAVERWREVIQEKNIYVFKRSFKQKSISGFCLHDAHYPLIYVNNTNSHARQIFTLVHELAHLLLKKSEIVTIDSSWTFSDKKDSKGEEVLCNKIASEVLFPDKEWEKIDIDYEDEKEIEQVAFTYKISKEVVLRRAYDHNIIDKDLYENYSSEWKEKAINRLGKNGSGGNYYLTQITYLGKKYTNKVLSKYYKKNISIDQASEYLGIKQQNIEKMASWYEKGLR
jgi:Zn-dependent peptidase ImmA (M78 family)